ncbi:preprotein translocase subunit SecE [Candidatus Saccharibacteria bacterium]|nr:preprotein translocase subunit SecE [Candidatus Saccharibacteria bacterium]
MKTYQDMIGFFNVRGKMSKNDKPRKVGKKSDKTEKVSKNPFKMLLAYVKNSFREIKQSKFPNAKATRKMLFSVLVYVAIIILLIWGLDIFFSWVFRVILG